MAMKKTHPILIETAQYLLVILISIFLLFYVFHLWKVRLEIPLLEYRGDTLSGSVIFKTIMESGWVFTNPSLGAPFGANILFDYPTSDAFQYLIIIIFSSFSHDAPLIYNLYYLVGFPLVAISAFYVFKKLKISFFIALPGAIAFAFLPFHILRYAHLFLASYYMVPLGLLAITEAANGNLNVVSQNQQNGQVNIKLKRRKFWFYILVCILTACTGVYYAFFIAFIGFISAVRCFFLKDIEDRLIRIKICCVFILFILVTAAINGSPIYLNQSVNGIPTESVAVRPTSDAELYGLKITQLLLPSSLNRFSKLVNINREYSNEAPLVNENYTASLGLIGVIGFLYSMIVLFLQQRKNELDHYLSFVNISCVLLGTIGGFGSLIAFFIIPSIRGYNRISVVIGFISIALFCQVAQHFMDFVKSKGFTDQRTTNAVFSWGLCLLFLGIIIIDQCYIPNFLSNYRKIETSYKMDKQFAQNIEKVLPQGAMIFQLPFMPFPENGPINGMGDYDHFRPYLFTSGLEWSYGDTRGRKASNWNEATSKLPTEQIFQRLSAAGFSGIYIDRYGYQDAEKEIERVIRSLAKIDPIVSDDQRFAIYDIRTYANDYRSKFSADQWRGMREQALHLDPIITTTGKCSNIEGKPGNYWIWCGSKGEIIVSDYEEKDRNIILNFEVSTGTGEEALLITKIGSSQKQFKISGNLQPIQLVIPMKAGQFSQTINIESNAHLYNPGNGDARELVFILFNPTISFKTFSTP